MNNSFISQLCFVLPTSTFTGVSTLCFALEERFYISNPAPPFVRWGDFHEKNWWQEEDYLTKVVHWSWSEGFAPLERWMSQTPQQGVTFFFHDTFVSETALFKKKKKERLKFTGWAYEDALFQPAEVHWLHLVDSCHGDSRCHCSIDGGFSLCFFKLHMHRVHCIHSKQLLLEPDTECEVGVKVQSWRLLHPDPTSVLSKLTFSLFPRLVWQYRQAGRLWKFCWCLTDLFSKAELETRRTTCWGLFFGGLLGQETWWMDREWGKREIRHRWRDVRERHRTASTRQTQ